MTEIPELLPLGSAVSIQGDDGVYIIIARGFQKSAEGFLAGYKAFPHPSGALAGVKEIVIRQTQIVEVVHRGHETPEDVVFAKKQLENAKTPPAKQPDPVEPDLTIDLTRPDDPPAAPQPGAGAGVGAVANPRDPFSELRIKGKRK
ncbi:DUF4176 domain-containing protein [Leifsonia sp. NPDC014704]|uniref:DUF4176 domain-containing protein n=1 Tax=Leifsonia sp. NPDC014704 TaxID=3364123 RepID=UPI0036F45E73